MNSNFKASIIFLILFSLVAGVAAQPTPPHEVYGTITDGGDAIEGVTVEAVASDSDTFSATTDSEGYYSIQVPSDKSSFDVLVDGTTEKEGLTVESGAIEEHSFSGDYGLVVSVDDTSVDEEETVEVSASVSNAAGDASYTWTIEDDPTGDATIDGGQETADFNAPEVDSDTDITVKLTVEGTETVSDTATVTVFDTETVTDGGSTAPEEEEPETKQVDAEIEDGQASADVGAVEENQEVQVSIPDTDTEESTVEKVSFTSSSSSASVSVSVRDLGTERPEGVESAGTDVHSYQEINIEGVTDEDITDSSINFKVQKSFLEERDRPAEDIVLKRYNNQNWQELDTRMDEELDNAYRFEASSTGFSYYAVALTEEPEPTANIQTSSLNVQPTEGTPPFDVTVEVTVENSGDAAGSKEIEVMLGDEVVGSETVDLDAGESTTFTFDYTVEEAGSLSFTAGEQSVTVNASQSGTGNLLMLVVVVIAAILAGTAYYKRDFIQEKVEEFREEDEEEDYSFT